MIHENLFGFQTFQLKVPAAELSGNKQINNFAPKKNITLSKIRKNKPLLQGGVLTHRTQQNCYNGNMDDPTAPSGPASATSPQDLAAELTHINREVYKKSVELAERNKTLLILRKIDEIILSEITHPEEIGKQVTSLLVKEADFKIAAIYVFNEAEKSLQQLAISESSEIQSIKKQTNTTLTLVDKVLLFDVQNIQIQAISEKQVKGTNSLQQLLKTDGVAIDIAKYQASIAVLSILIYPLIVRNDIIGTMVIGLPEEIKDLTEYQRDLLIRLAEGVGIALDNALLYNKLQAANEQLKALDKLKDEFVSIASHELRTPMTAIKSYLWLFLNDKTIVVNPRQKTYLERAYSSTDRLIALVNDMLNVSRIESGRFVINAEPINLPALANEVIADLVPAAQKQGNQILLTQPPEPFPNALADSDKIREVFINLIGNSIKFTPLGGTITVSFAQDNDMVITKVSDTGRGLAPEDVTKLFQKFGRVGGNYLVKQNVQGTGLGLYLTRSIVQLHGGKIWAESQGIGKGSTFSFTLKNAS